MLASELSESMKDLFQNVTNQSIPPGKSDNQVIPTTSFGFDFNKASQDYWMKQGVDTNNAYRKGNLMGGVKSHAQLYNFITILTNAIQEAIRDDLKKNEKTSENLKYAFDTYNNLSKLLCQLSLKESPTPNMKCIMATIQGAINSFIETSITNNEN
jgi:hypothetical protein